MDNAKSNLYSNIEGSHSSWDLYHYLDSNIRGGMNSDAGVIDSSRSCPVSDTLPTAHTITRTCYDPPIYSPDATSLAQGTSNSGLA